MEVAQNDVDKAKIASLQENKPNIEKAHKLNEEGNLLVKNNKLVGAIEKYSEAIYQPWLPSWTTVLAILHSNRSFARLKLGDYDGGKEDAKGAPLGGEVLVV